MPHVPDTKELYASHIPALEVLMALGYEYVSPGQCLEHRGSTREVLMTPVLVEELKKRRFEYKGKRYPLSQNGIDQVVREISTPRLNEGLLAANERIYDLLTLGVTVTEFIDGRKAQPTIPLIDWYDIDNNRFQVTEELEVQPAKGTEPRRPDIVVYVNGIPFVVIEAKRPDAQSAKKKMVKEGVSQQIRNQRDEYIPLLFAYAQLLLSVASTDALYGTTKTPAKFWGKWREEEFTEALFSQVRNTDLTTAQKEALFERHAPKVRAYFEELWSGKLLATEQDKLLVSLCSKARLLELVRYFIIYDKKKSAKIVARYQQYFGTKTLITRMTRFNKDGGREGGVIWHTTGSGKSFTMVYLCKALILTEALKNCRIIVVTDRIDLEKQLKKTFASAGAFGSDVGTKKDGDKARAVSGRDLAMRIGKGNERIIFTLINKFESAFAYPECKNTSENIIVLIDEGHRSQGGENHERMRLALPNAAYVAFTGTPLLTDDKTTNKFGPILHAYTMQRAIEDRTVTPLLYEERKPELEVNETAIDNWFDKITEGLTDTQRTDLKKKFQKRGAVYGAQNRLDLIAWDISTHFSESFKKTMPGMKGQMATDSKTSAIKYKKAFDDIGKITTAVVISPPDTREGHEEVDAQELPLVQQWWRDNVGSQAEEVYTKNIIENFDSDGDPDLLIVVDKLLTGFDEPRNTVLYIDKNLREHNLIQAIARVNRLHEQKRYGYLVDYRGILKELDTAIADYQDLEQRTQGGYDIEDLEGLYSSVSTEYKKLPGLHRKLWEVFRDVENKRQIEQFRQVLIPKCEEQSTGKSYDVRLKVREDFYEALTAFGICLKVALSSREFFLDSAFPEATITRYKEDLKFFTHLRMIAKRDADEVVDYSKYDEQIKRLVDKFIVANSIKGSGGIYAVSGMGQSDDPQKWSKEKLKNETDLIKSRVKRTIEVDLDDDPYAQKVFSELLKEAIAQAEALFDYSMEQLELFQDFEQQVKDRAVPGRPEVFADNPMAGAYYGIFNMVLEEDGFKQLEETGQVDFVAQAFEFDTVVTQAVREHSLSPENISAAITKSLLPKLYKVFGLEKAKAVIAKVVSVVERGAVSERDA